MSFFNFFRRKDKVEYDLVFVVFEQSRGWILEAICLEIAKYFPGKYTFHYSSNNLPQSRAYFYAHYSFYHACLKKNPQIASAIHLLWFTHPRFDLGKEDAIFSSLKKATYVLTPCTHNFAFLSSQNVPDEKMKLILGAADAELFSKGDRQSKGVIGFSTAYYERKRPDRIIGLIEAFPMNDFILLGKDWLQSAYADKIKSFKNLEYVEAPYETYPAYYEKMDVFIAPSDLEGGPIPLLESMMSNVVPVACDTGFARDFIQHKENGYIFAKDAPLTEIVELVKEALTHKGNIRSTVEKYTWEFFSQQVQDCLKTK